MSSLENFKTELYNSATQKESYLDSIVLPKMLDNYRAIHSSIKNLIDLFEKKKLLKPDPYKRESHLVDIVIPSTDEFQDSEGATILGIRLAEYEMSLDFLCNYIPFTAENLQPDRIKKLFMFNSFLDWNTSSHSNNQSSSRYLRNIVNTIKTGSDTLSIGVLNNLLNVVTQKFLEINADLKNLSLLQKEFYKIDVRRRILDNPNFAKQYSTMSRENGLSEIKKVFTSFMDKKKYYPILIEEIIDEEFSPNKEDLQKKVLSTLHTETKKIEEDVEKIDTRALLFDVIKILPTFTASIESISLKIQENHELLQSERKSAFNKFIEALRIAFGLKSKKIEYKIRIIDMTTNLEKIEIIDFNEFMNGLKQKSRIFNALGSKNSTVYKKLENDSEEAILAFIQKRISECQTLHGTLSGFDNFFKSTIMQENRSKIKGLKMDLDLLKNNILKANRNKAEYISAKTFESQMSTLGAHIE